MISVFPPLNDDVLRLDPIKNSHELFRSAFLLILDVPGLLHYPWWTSVRNEETSTEPPRAFVA